MAEAIHVSSDEDARSSSVALVASDSDNGADDGNAARHCLLDGEQARSASDVSIDGDTGDGAVFDYAKLNFVPTTVMEADNGDSSDSEPPAKKKKNQHMPAPKDRWREVPTSGPTDPTLPDIGFDKEAVGMLEAFGVHRLLFYILAILYNRTEFDNACNIDTAEYFSGAAQVTKNLALRGLAAVSFDVFDEIYQNINGVIGFICALQILRRVRPASGLVWLGTVCSSWIFLSRDSTMQSHQDARGDRNRRCVRAGNRQAARSAVIIAIAFCRKLGWVVEHPGSSILWWHPAMLHCQHIALDLGLMWHHIETYMHHFQAKHVKKTVLCSNESWTQNLARSHPGQQANITAIRVRPRPASERAMEKNRRRGTRAAF